MLWTCQNQKRHWPFNTSFCVCKRLPRHNISKNQLNRSRNGPSKHPRNVVTHYSFFFCCYACVTAGHATRDLCFQNYFTGVYKFPWAQQIQISTQSDLNGSSRHPSKVATPSSFLSCCYGRDRTRNAIGNNTFEPSFQNFLMIVQPFFWGTTYAKSSQLKLKQIFKTSNQSYYSSLFLLMLLWTDQNFMGVTDFWVQHIKKLLNRS